MTSQCQGHYSSVKKVSENTTILNSS